MYSGKNEIVPVSVSKLGMWGSFVDFFGDKRFVAGTILGLSLLAGGVAISASNVFSQKAFGEIDNTILTDQESVITEQMKQDARDCAQGDKEGTVGNAINMSLKAHLELASAMPNIETLFDVNTDCFATISALIDLSWAIPSLASILAAAEQAVIAYAKKKICTAVQNVTGMVTGPINQAIGTVNQYIGALNGLSSNLNNGGSMSFIDVNLGSKYNIGHPGTYTMNQPYGKDKKPPMEGQSIGDSNNLVALQQVMQELGTAQSELANANGALGQAQQALDGCRNKRVGNCDSEESAVNIATQIATSIQNQITGLQNHLNDLTSANSPIGINRPIVVNQQPPAVIAPKNQSLTKKLGNLFE